jgi:hypothetical protein
MTVVRMPPAVVRKLLTLPGVADTDIFSMNTWNTLPESYQQRVYNITVATVKHQKKQAEKPAPPMANSIEPTSIHMTILLDYLTTEMALAEPENRSTEPEIPIHKICTNYELHFGLPGGSSDYEDSVDDSDIAEAIPTSCW